MTRPKRQVKRARDSSGTFISNKRAKIVLSKPGDSEIEIDIDTSDSDYDAEDEPSESELDNESDDEYLTIPEPSTWLATLSLASEVQPGGTIQVHSMIKQGSCVGHILLVGYRKGRQNDDKRQHGSSKTNQMADSGQNGWSLNIMLFGNFRVLLRYNAIRKFQSPPARENQSIKSFFTPKSELPESVPAPAVSSRSTQTVVMEIEDSDDEAGAPLPCDPAGPILLYIGSDDDNNTNSATSDTPATLTSPGSSTLTTPEKEVLAADSIADFVEGAASDDSEAKTWPELQALAGEAKVRARKAKNYRDDDGECSTL
ncbi:hypothetical protein DFH07DRAFT_783054 [Mycena maculata]|uniref:Uncharacterized protein n=1 Tax=Mycena maculata TaxID=230809 RepID=A0AAD7HPK2_9AGAR|nr:hypothetical protein DFH07DRAFT_783054 [Mycena maculata]